ncbi:MAG: methyltransferase family protein [Mariprofundaceae bacterium]
MSNYQQKQRKVPAWQRLVLEHRIIVSAVLVLLVIGFVRPSCWSISASLPLIALGEALRLWASGHIQKMKEVTNTGPYALCRHPLYLGHFLIAAGFCVAGNNIWVSLFVLPGFWIIFHPTMQKEELLLVEKFGMAYEDYRRESPQFWPRWSKLALRGGHDWKLVRQHREWNNVLGLLALLVLMAAIGLWRGSW